MTLLGSHKCEYEESTPTPKNTTLYTFLVNLKGTKSPSFMELLTNMTEEDQRWRHFNAPGRRSKKFNIGNPERKNGRGMRWIPEG